MSFDVALGPQDLPAIAAYVKRAMTKEPKTTWWRSDVALVAFVDVLSLIGVGIIAASKPDTEIIIGSIFLVASFLGIQLAVNVIARRQLRRALADLTGHFRIDGSGVTASQPGRTSFVATDTILGLDVTTTHVFLGLTPQTFWVMPRRCIGGPDEQASALALLTAPLPNLKGRRPG